MGLLLLSITLKGSAFPKAKAMKGRLKKKRRLQTRRPEKYSSLKDRLYGKKTPFPNLLSQNCHRAPWLSFPARHLVPGHNLSRGQGAPWLVLFHREHDKMQTQMIHLNGSRINLSFGSEENLDYKHSHLGLSPEGSCGHSSEFYNYTNTKTVMEIKKRILILLQICHPNKSHFPLFYALFWFFSTDIIHSSHSIGFEIFFLH